MTETKEKMKPGDRMKDGTVFAGISPDTGSASICPPMMPALAAISSIGGRDAPSVYSVRFLGV